MLATLIALPCTTIILKDRAFVASMATLDEEKYKNGAVKFASDEVLGAAANKFGVQELLEEKDGAFVMQLLLLLLLDHLMLKWGIIGARMI